MLRTLLVAAVCCLLAAPAQAERRIALVIGNSAYQYAPALANPVNDARDVAATLTAAGFQVQLGLDLDKAGFDRQLRGFGRELAAADVALVFYAGHGLQVSGRNYLVPTDARLDSERDLDFETIRLELLLAQMELDRDGKTSIVFLDACRDNPLSRNLARSMGTRSAALGRGLAQVQSGVGTFVSFSTQPGNVALDGSGRNSPFAAALARHARTPGRNLNAVMIEVRKDVIAATQGRQVPWDHSALTGEFYFMKAAAPGGPGARPVPAQSSEQLAALQERLRQLETDAERRNAAAGAQAMAVLSQLRGQEKAIEAELRRSQSMVFDLQRAMSREQDAQRRGELAREMHQLNVAMLERRKFLTETKAEIARLEGEGGGAAPRFAGFKPSGQDGEVELYAGAKPSGELIEAGRPSPSGDCSGDCRAKSGCVAFAVEKGTGICEAYRSISGLQAATGWTTGLRARSSAAR